MKTGTGCLFAALAAALMMSCDNNVRMEGTLVLAHEVRTFTPDGDTATYWIVDKTGTLARQYDELTGGVKNGIPVHADIEVIDMGKSDEGFAKGYKSVWQIVKINELTLMDEFPVGADRDGHGCIGSAGYVWSEAMQDCIRLFESGIRTEAVDGSGRSAYIVFSRDSLKAELFFSDGEKAELLDQRTLPTGEHVWNVEDDDTKNVRFSDGAWTISQRGNLLFSQSAD